MINKFGRANLLTLAVLLFCAKPCLAYKLPDDDFVQFNVHNLRDEVSQLQLAKVTLLDNFGAADLEHHFSLYWLAFITKLDNKSKTQTYVWLIENAPFDWDVRKSRAIAINNACVMLLNRGAYSLAVKKLEALVREYPEYSLGPSNLRVARNYLQKVLDDLPKLYASVYENPKDHEKLVALENALRSAGKDPKSFDDDAFWDIYMDHLQRQIKRNFNPPKMPSSSVTVTLFKVDKKGFLSDPKITKSSGSAELDKACLQALRDASPFDPLPVSSKPTVDVQFTFSYNVLTHAGLTSEISQKRDDSISKSPQIRDDKFPTSKILAYNDKFETLVNAKWNAHGSTNSAQIVVLLTVSDDGKIGKLRIHRSSGDPKIDSLALETIRSCAPLSPPPKIPNNIPYDLEYTFDSATKN